MRKSFTANLTPQKVRLILIGSTALLIGLSAALFIFSRGILLGYATDVQQITATADASSENLKTLDLLKKKLAEDKPSVERAKSLVADSKAYAYQDQIIKDLSTYASKAGVSIEGFQFNEAAANGATPAPAAAPAADGAVTAPTASIGGLKTVSVAITLKSPQGYENIMKFIHSIEQNLTKMQLDGISMSLDKEKGGITLSTLTVGVYTR